MEAKKNLCGMIPEELHARAVAEKEQLGLKTLGEYVELILKEHFEGGRITMAETKTLAFKITEELDQRLKNFIAAEKKHGRKITQREFVIGLIEQALDAYEAQYLSLIMTGMISRSPHRTMSQTKRCLRQPKRR